MAIQSAYYIPNGPKNLAPIFPAIDFTKVAEYFVEVIDSEGNVIATSTLNKVGCCCCDEGVRVHFLNYLGTFDAIDFPKPKVSHDDTSSEFQKGLPYPLQKTDSGIERFDVRSNDTYEVTCKFLETDKDWIQECKDSPKAFMEWNGKQGQPASYVPIVILAGTLDKLKNDNEFDYKFTMKYKLSNEFQTIRN